jgi:hypothetical protein
MKNLPVSTSMPAGARYMLGDVFITASADDHSNFVLGRNLTPELNWVDPRGTQPSTVFGKAMARHAVTLNYPGENDGFTSSYGIWYSSQTIPLNTDGTFDFDNAGNSGSKGWVYMVVKAFSL